MRLFAAPAPFEELGTDYEFGMVDPPWPTKMRSPKGESKSSAAQYGSMAFEEICALPVDRIMAKTSVLMLWCTWPMVLYGGDPDLRYLDHNAARSRVGEVVKSWGYRYVSGGAWFKRTVTGKPSFGPGYRVRTSCEPFFLCIKGNPSTVAARRMRNAIESIVDNAFDGLRREHSRKPEEAYQWCEQYLPGARRVELFSRTTRPGWDTWGYEAGKFDPVVSLQAEGEAA
jgi:N6-adenosine-specific RNA methylase IME4